MYLKKIFKLLLNIKIFIIIINVFLMMDEMTH